MMKNIAILTPTRGRPERCRNFIDSVKVSAFDPFNINMHFYVDEDDPFLEEYRHLVDDFSEEYLKYSHVPFCSIRVGEPQSVSKSWNNLLWDSIFFSSTDIIIMGNDDQIYQTKQWDKILRDHVETYKDDIYCVWFEDGINGEKHCAFPIVSRKWVETLGYFTPGIFNFGYNDTWIFDIAKRIGRTHFIPEILVEHNHFTVGKSEMDDTYARNRIQERGNLYAKDKIIFENTTEQRENDAEKLRKVML